MNGWVDDDTRRVEVLTRIHSKALFDMTVPAIMYVRLLEMDASLRVIVLSFIICSACHTHPLTAAMLSVCVQIKADATANSAVGYIIHYDPNGSANTAKKFFADRLAGWNVTTDPDIVNRLWNAIEIGVQGQPEAGGSAGQYNISMYEYVAYGVAYWSYSNQNGSKGLIYALSAVYELSPPSGIIKSAGALKKRKAITSSGTTIFLD